jgi:putative aldouronate transport system substrate-binding protein
MIGGVVKMKKTKSLVLTAILIASVSASMFAGCAKDKAETTGSTGGDPNKIEPITIKYWSEMTGNLTGVVSSLGETEFYKNLEKKTGVHVEFIHPAAGQAKEAFSLMLASQDLPDCIEYSMFQYSGGPQKALDDGVIVPLNDLMDKYMPNLKKTLGADEEVNKRVKTDAGKYYSAPAIIGTAVTRGLMMRKDWLDELGLPVPTTIDEWTTTLRAFKEKKGATAPYIATQNDLTGVMGPYFSSDYGFAAKECYLDADGKTVKYGAIQPGYKELLGVFAEWYKEGLIDKDFITNKDSKQFDAKVTSNKGGAFGASLSSGMGKYLDLMKKENPKFDLVGVPIPVKTKGTKPSYGLVVSPYKDLYDVSITTANKHKEDTAKWLDYGYSKEGNMFFNYGIEGDTYTMVNNVPTYTEKVTKHSQGIQKALSLYTRVNYGGPFVNDINYLKQYYTYPQKQMPAMEGWSDFTVKKGLPRLTFTSEESRKIADLGTSISSRVDEMAIKFIMGQVPFSDWDKYVKEINDLGVQEVVKINQTAYDRYLKR